MYHITLQTEKQHGHSRGCLLTVPPNILDYPTSTDMVVREGSNVTLKCAASGSPQPIIIWRREGNEPISSDGNLKQNKKKITSIMVEPLFSQCLSASFFVATASSHNTSTFSIPRVNRLDMGAYLCIASNGIPPSVSKRVMLIVHCEYMKPLPLFKLVFREQNNSTSAFKIIKINGSSYHKKMHATLILVDIKCFEN